MPEARLGVVLAETSTGPQAEIGAAPRSPALQLPTFFSTGPIIPGQRWFRSIKTWPIRFSSTILLFPSGPAVFSLGEIPWHLREAQPRSYRIRQTRRASRTI